MTPAGLPSAALIARLERLQLAALRRGGFDPETFVGRTDMVELSPARRAAVTGGAWLMRLAGRTGLADNLGSLAKYMNAVAPGARAFPGLLRAAAAAAPSPPTRYQRQDDHLLLWEMRGRLADAIGAFAPDDPRRGLQETLARTTLATAPLGRCNAMIFADPGQTQFAVIVDDELARLLVQMGLLYGRLIRSNGAAMVLDSALAEQRLAMETPEVGAFRSLVDVFLTRGTSELAASLGAPSAFEVGVMTTFVQLAWVWILAHELAHAHLGHLKALGGQWGLLEEDDADPAAEAAFILAAENEADRLATEVTQAACVRLGCNPGLAVPAAAMVLQVFSSVYAGVAGRAAPSGPSEAREIVIRDHFRHPTPDERLSRLIAPRRDTWAWYVRQGLAGVRSAAGPQLHPRWTPLADALRTA